MDRIYCKMPLELNSRKTRKKRLRTHQEETKLQLSGRINGLTLNIAALRIVLGYVLDLSKEITNFARLIF